MEETAAAAVHGVDFYGLFLQADVVVKSVMILLALASVGCWTVIVEKILEVGALKRQTRRFELATGAGDPARAAKRGLPAAVMAAAVEAWRDNDPAESRSERRDRIERAMRAAVSARLRRAEWGLPFLATVGSAAPFIGLFGTVWGIMNSFSAIAQSQDTSLAVVAPGIAEALFATALGLVAAIPAVIGYNKATTDLTRVSQRLGAIIGHVGNTLARERATSPLREAAE